MSLNTTKIQYRESFVHPAIRRYEKKDEIAVLQLSQKYASWDSTPTGADIQGFYSSEPDFFLVAELNQRIVGFIFGRESKNVPDEVLRRWRATKVGSVEVLAVEERHRRRGIATLLLNRLFTVFKDRGIDTVTLSVPADESGAKELYDKLGFVTRGYFMKKTL
jgi:ribosomal protein S18 acetylase RimI-like enzyme